MIGNAGRLVAGAAGETTEKLRDKGIPSLSMADGPAGVRISRKYWVDADGAHSVGNTMLEGLSDFLPKPAAIISKLFTSSKPKHGEKGTLLCLSDDLILLHSIYKKCDVDHKIVIFLNQNRYIQNH